MGRWTVAEVWTKYSYLSSPELRGAPIWLDESCQTLGVDARMRLGFCFGSLGFQMVCLGRLVGIFRAVAGSIVWLLDLRQGRRETSRHYQEERHRDIATWARSRDLYSCKYNKYSYKLINTLGRWNRLTVVFVRSGSDDISVVQSNFISVTQLV